LTTPWDYMPMPTFQEAFAEAQLLQMMKIKVSD
jgi:hypothetical protein